MFPEALADMLAALDTARIDIALIRPAQALEGAAAVTCRISGRDGGRTRRGRASAQGAEEQQRGRTAQQEGDSARRGRTCCGHGYCAAVSPSAAFPSAATLG
jgi:hypothetical protein